MSADYGNGSGPLTWAQFSAYMEEFRRDLAAIYATRLECEQRHKYLDPREMWKTSAVTAVLTTAFVGVMVFALTHFMGS